MVVIPGTANEKSSDLGLTVINYREPDPVVQIDVIKSALEKHHPVISKMDIDPGVLEDVMLTANDRRWGYCLKHHCVGVYGEDLRNLFKSFRPSRKLLLP
ncbi:hypothetical protein [Pantoea sp. AS142]|uniref:hypothetical protein n=1 Tax=Pantoea sp. AS142 TaxID=3081292 RepID=UPI003019A2E4